MADSYSDQPAHVKSRRYVSTRRAQQAQETRRLIYEAARRLFVVRGYAASTIDEIASAAGVARPTVFAAVGTKRDIIKHLRDVALAGDEDPVAVPDRERFQRIWREPNPKRVLAMYAENMRTMHGRAADLEAVIEAAADSDPEMRQLLEAAHRQRRDGCGRIAAALDALKALRPDLDEHAAGDVIFAIASPAVYRMLVGSCGWSAQRYGDWLSATLTDELLGRRATKWAATR